MLKNIETVKSDKQSIPAVYREMELCIDIYCFNMIHVRYMLEKCKQKSPGRATSRSRSQPPTPGGREKVTQINVCIANKQMHDKHRDQLPLPQAR